MLHIYLHHDIFTVNFVGILSLCFSFFQDAKRNNLLILVMPV